MPFLTPENITSPARAYASTWTLLDLSVHGRLQTQDVISIIEYPPGLKMLCLGSDGSLGFDLVKILQKALKNCWTEHPSLYQAHFEDSYCQQHFGESLIRQIVVAETDGSEVFYSVMPAADDCFSVLRLITARRRMRHFAHLPPASKFDALAMIEDAFALEESQSALYLPLTNLMNPQGQPCRATDAPTHASLGTIGTLYRLVPTIQP
jgi:hypothetical protein